MKVRWKIPVAGTVHGIPEGVKPGDVTEVDDTTGARYCRWHLAEPVVDRKEERAVAPEGEQRTIAVGDDKAEETEAKRGPGRPPKAQ